MRVLYKKHDSDIEIEASTLLQPLIGKGFHLLVEKATKTGVAERRMSIMVNGWKLSGGMDHYDLLALDNAILIDYKTTNVWKMVYAKNGIPDGFENQLNVYAEILRQNGCLVSKLEIFAVFKDWKDKEKLKVKNYPQKDWARFELPLWSQEKAQAYILERVKLHQDAEKELPKCSSSDIWNGIRCRRYCNVSKWCEQFNKQSKTGLME